MDIPAGLVWVYLLGKVLSHWSVAEAPSPVTACGSAGWSLGVSQAALHNHSQPNLYLYCFICLPVNTSCSYCVPSLCCFRVIFWNGRNPGLLFWPLLHVSLPIAPVQTLQKRSPSFNKQQFANYPPLYCFQSPRWLWGARVSSVLVLLEEN